jgi:hypothetical protein
MGNNVTEKEQCNCYKAELFILVHAFVDQGITIHAGLRNQRIRLEFYVRGNAANWISGFNLLPNLELLEKRYLNFIK